MKEGTSSCETWKVSQEAPLIFNFDSFYIVKLIIKIDILGNAAPGFVAWQTMDIKPDMAKHAVFVVNRQRRPSFPGRQGYYFPLGIDFSEPFRRKICPAVFEKTFPILDYITSTVRENLLQGDIDIIILGIPLIPLILGKTGNPTARKTTKIAAKTSFFI